MGEKKSEKKGEKKIDERQSKKGNNDDDDDDRGKDGNVLTVVLKVNLHCEGCSTKIKKTIRGFEGVKSVRGGDGESNKLTVSGTFDPVKLREVVEKKANTKVELVSGAPPKKDKDKESSNSNKGKKKDGGGGDQNKAGTGDNNKTEKSPDDKKSKETPVTTAVMKVDLHCEGCIQKIRKTVAKTKGYNGISIDEQKNLVTVKGTMDMKALAEILSEKLKKPVEIIVTPKKDGGGGGGKKGKGDGGDGSSGNGEVAPAPGDGGGGGNSGGEENRIQFLQYGYPNPPMNGFGSGYPIEHFSAPASQMFSDENPNACSIM